MWRCAGQRPAGAEMGNLACRTLGMRGTQGPAEAIGRCEPGRCQAPSQGTSEPPLCQGTRDTRLHQLTPNVDESAICHTRWTGGLAVSAGEAAVEVGLGLAANRLALEHLLH